MVEAFKPGLCLEWKGLNYFVPVKENINFCLFPTFKKPKNLTLLNYVSGYMHTGDLVAILGCSGAGKTTLLAAISQRLSGNLSGEILLNGAAMKRAEMIRISSFLPQCEMNVQTLTAQEHLYFMSHFKMDRKTSKCQKHERVDDLLLTVGLTHVQNTRIEQLSGGERKRLSLAEELITDPLFLFCDEPTSGLDSYNAYTVVKTLRRLAVRHRLASASLTTLYGDDSRSSSSNNSSIEMEPLIGDSFTPKARFKKAIICSIHQPTSDIFELFTHIILMDAGRVVYQGRTEEAFDFFNRLGFTVPPNCNPADFYLKCISDSHTNRTDGDFVKTKYDQQMADFSTNSWLFARPYTGEYLKLMGKTKKIWWPLQVYFLLKRQITEDMRNWKQCFMSMAFFMITSVTLAILYFGVRTLDQTSIQNIDGSIYMLSNEIVFTVSYGVTYLFPKSLPIMRREVGEGTYNLSAYYVAIVLSFIPMAFFKSFAFFAVVYGSIYMYRGLMLYLTMSIVLSLSAVTATAYGLLLSTIFESEYMASECAAPFDLLFLTFGGAYYNVDSIPFLKYFSMFFYSNEALMYNFWIDVENIDCSSNEDHPCITNGREVLERASFRTSDDTFWTDCLALIVLAIVFNIIAFCFVRKYVKRRLYY